MTRRRLLALVPAGAAGVVLAGCSGGGEPGGGSAAQRAEVDVELLNAVLDLEHTTVAAYGAAAARLRGDLVRVGRRFREHEREHAARLARLVRELGGAPRPPRSAYDLPALRDEAGALRLVAELEDASVAAYIDALPRLSQPELRGELAGIVAAEAEHLAILHEALGQEPVPQPFVTGRSR